MLTKYSVPKVVEIDTIENYPDRGLFIFGVVTNHAMGKFEYDYLIVKENNGNRLSYKIEKGKLSGRISKDFIALVEPNGILNWGWFNVKNKELSGVLPDVERMLDSLKSASPKDYFIKETNGYVSTYKAGKVVSSYNYGNVVIGKSEAYLSNLKAGLYKLEAHDVRLISDNADDLFKQNNGVFFIPLPGYGVIKKFKKEMVFKAIDSAASLPVSPEKITIPAN